MADGRGGDVSGTTKIDTTRSVSSALEVASKCFEPGYSTEKAMPDTSKADLKRGYCDYGKSIGE